MRSWWGAELIDNNSARTIWAQGRRAVTIGELRSEIDMLARLFRAHDIRGGNTVALHGCPSFTQVWAIFALWSLGAQVIQLEPNLAVADRRQLLDVCAPQFLVTFGDPAAEFVDECSVLVRRLPGGLPARSSHCIVQFSSGTAGPPKVVGRTSESILVELDRFHTLADMPVEGEKVAILESVAHSFGLIGGLLYALDVGATVLFQAADISTADMILGNPRALARLSNATLPRLRLAVSGGEMLPMSTYRTFASRFGVRVGQAYGTTETGIVAADLPGAYGPPAVGVPLAGVRTRIIGGVLEVHVPQSPYLTKDEGWTGGWMSTHDLAAADPDTGVLRLCGRASTLDLARVEEALRAHRRVVEAVVLAGDPVVAHVAAIGDVRPDELRLWCRRMLGADAVIPDLYHIAPDLPRTANGKVLRDRYRLFAYSSV